MEHAGNDGISLARLAAIVPFAVAVDHAEQLDPIPVAFLPARFARVEPTELSCWRSTSTPEYPQGPTGGNPALNNWLNEEPSGAGRDPDSATYVDQELTESPSTAWVGQSMRMIWRRWCSQAMEVPAVDYVLLDPR